MTTKKMLSEYSKRVFVNWYGLFQGILAVLTVLSFLDVDLGLSTWWWFTIFLISLCVGIFAGGFLAYQQVVKERPSEAELSIEEREPKIFHSGGWDNKMPQPPYMFRIHLDIYNRGEEEAVLSSVPTVEQVTLGTDLFEQKTVKVDVYQYDIQRGGRYKITETNSISIPGRKGIYSAWCELSFELRDDNLQAFARQLSELQDWQIELLFIYDTAGVKKSVQVSLQGSFEDFREKVKQHWREKGAHDLLVLAEGGEV